MCLCSFNVALFSFTFYSVNIRSSTVFRYCPFTPEWRIIFFIDRDDTRLKSKLMTEMPISKEQGRVGCFETAAAYEG